MPTIIAEEDGERPRYYTFAMLKADGFVGSRNHLRELLKAGFPAAIKARPTLQARAIYHGPSVRAWARQQAQAANFLPPVVQKRSYAKKERAGT